MQKNDESKKIILGALIGGLIGGTALYFMHSSRNNPKPILSKIARAISDMGEILEESQVDCPEEAIDEIGKSIPKGDEAINNVLTWVATGIHLWKNFKKGN